jgi:hypothetical protein
VVTNVIMILTSQVTFPRITNHRTGKTQIAHTLAVSTQVLNNLHFAFLSLS